MAQKVIMAFGKLFVVALIFSLKKTEARNL